MNQEIMNLFSPQVPAQVFDQIRISIASPEKILSWSYGEIRITKKGLKKTKI